MKSLVCLAPVVGFLVIATHFVEYMNPSSIEGNSYDMNFVFSRIDGFKNVSSGRTGDRVFRGLPAENNDKWFPSITRIVSSRIIHFIRIP